MKFWNLSILALYFFLVKEYLCFPVKDVKGDRRLLAAIFGYRKEDTGFIKDVLRVHNKYRRIHGCPDLGQCARLRQQAGLYAQKLADQGAQMPQADPNLEPGIGENIFISCGNEVSGEEVVNHWYEEVCNYFDNKKSYNEYKHFAQVVWKASYLIGIGRRTSEKSGQKCTYVVTRYRPGAEQGPAESANIPKGSFDPNGICSANTVPGGQTGASTQGGVLSQPMGNRPSGQPVGLSNAGFPATDGSNTAQSTGESLPGTGKPGGEIDQAKITQTTSGGQPAGYSTPSRSVGSEDNRGEGMAGSNGITGSNSIPGMTSTRLSGVLGTGDRERAKNPENSHISPLIEQHETGSQGSSQNTDGQQMSPAPHCPPCPGKEIQTETSGGAKNLPESRNSPLRPNREAEQSSKPDKPVGSTNAGNPTEQGKPAEQTSSAQPDNLPDRGKPVEQTNPVASESPANPDNPKAPGDVSSGRGKQCPPCLCPNREKSGKVDRPQSTQANQPQTGGENEGSPSQGEQVEPSGNERPSGKEGTQEEPKNVGQQGNVPSGKEGGEGAGGNGGSPGSSAGGSEGPRESSAGRNEGSQGSSEGGSPVDSPGPSAGGNEGSQGSPEGGSSVDSPGSSAGGNEGPQGSPEGGSSVDSPGSSAGGNEGSKGSPEGGSSVDSPGSSAGGNEGPQESTAGVPEGKQGSPAGGNEGSREGTGAENQPQSGGVENAGETGGGKTGGDQEKQTGTPGSGGSRSIPEGGAFIEDPSVFQQSALKAHNKYRQFHNSPGLSLDSDMSASATEFAQKLAESGINNAEHSLKSSRVDEAENIYSACGTNPSGADVTKEWYKELCNYNYNKHAAIDATKETGHFTQVIWKSSTKFGIGRAYGSKEGNKDCIYVVARYKPPGNVVGSESTNIARGTMDAEYCGREFMAINSQENGDKAELSPEDQAKGSQQTNEENKQQASGSREGNNPESGNQQASTGPSSESNSAETGTGNENNQPNANSETNQAATTPTGTEGNDGNKRVKTPFLPGYLQKTILENNNKRYRGLRTE